MAQSAVGLVKELSALKGVGPAAAASKRHDGVEERAGGLVERLGASVVGRDPQRAEDGGTLCDDHRVK